VAVTFYRNLGVLICACGVLAFIIFGITPVSGRLFFNGGEVGPAIRLAMSAQHALESGHFPLQFANDYAIALQPLFLYYTPLAYGLSAIIQMTTGLDAQQPSCRHRDHLSSRRGRNLRDYPASGRRYNIQRHCHWHVSVHALLCDRHFRSGCVCGDIGVGCFPVGHSLFRKILHGSTLANRIGLILTTALFIISHKIFFPRAMILLGVLVSCSDGVALLQECRFC
jgi:hypothetical protein